MTEKGEQGEEVELGGSLSRSTVQELAELPTLYVNSVEPTFSTYDVRLVFGETLGSEGGDIKVRRHVKVMMSLEHAKVFASILTSGIARFEQVAGQEIPKFELARSAESEALSD